MCFSPQRRAIFRHQNFKKCSDTVSFLAFWLQNVLFATASCNFWFLCWAPASAPAALTGLLFDWLHTRIIEKTQHFATWLTFGADVSSFFWLSRYCIFFLLTWLLYSAFQLSILSEVCYLNFLRSFNLKSWHWIWNRTQLPRRLFVLVLFYDFKRKGERLNFVGQAWPCSHGLRQHLEAARLFSDGTFTFYAVECSGWKFVWIFFIIGQSCVCVCAWESCAYIRMICIYIYLFIYSFIIYLFICYMCIYIYTQYILLSRIQHLYNLVHALEETPRWAFEVEETTGCTEGGTVSASWQKKMVSHAYCWRFRNPHLSPPWMFFEIPSKQWEYLSYQPLQNFWTRSSTVSYL